MAPRDAGPPGRDHWSPKPWRQDRPVVQRKIPSAPMTDLMPREQIEAALKWLRTDKDVRSVIRFNSAQEMSEHMEALARTALELWGVVESAKMFLDVNSDLAGTGPLRADMEALYAALEPSHE